MDDLFPFSRCANPECSNRFHYREGRVFRFYERRSEDGQPANAHSVLHYWLCMKCEKLYTLESSDDGCGTILQLRCSPRATHAPPAESHRKRL